MLIITDAEMGFSGKSLFGPLSLKVEGGQIALLQAPSGAGKSTLLHWICGTPPPGLHASGQIHLDGKDITSLPAEDRQVGIMFQEALLFPHLTVGGNLAFGIPGSVPERERQRRISDTLARVGMPDMADRDPMTLSGGQKARISLMRSLMAEPQAILLDEPFSSLDPEIREEFSAFIRQEIELRRLPAVLVSHDPRDQEMATGPLYRLPETGGKM
ncbi:ATP-binding cassette domain-containing protein [Alphaproteobacteria bacterium LSUCC0684]